MLLQYQSNMIKLREYFFQCAGVRNENWGTKKKPTDHTLVNFDLLYSTIQLKTNVMLLVLVLRLSTFELSLLIILQYGSKLFVKIEFNCSSSLQSNIFNIWVSSTNVQDYVYVFKFMLSVVKWFHGSMVQSLGNKSSLQGKCKVVKQIQY